MPSYDEQRLKALEANGSNTSSFTNLNDLNNEYKHDLKYTKQIWMTTQQHEEVYLKSVS